MSPRWRGKPAARRARERLEHCRARECGGQNRSRFDHLKCKCTAVSGSLHGLGSASHFQNY
jgi:hypothetical protein